MPRAEHALARYLHNAQPFTACNIQRATSSMQHSVTLTSSVSMQSAVCTSQPTSERHPLVSTCAWWAPHRQCSPRAEVADARTDVRTLGTVGGGGSAQKNLGDKSSSSDGWLPPASVTLRRVRKATSNANRERHSNAVYRRGTDCLGRSETSGCRYACSR